MRHLRGLCSFLFLASLSGCYVLDDNCLQLGGTGGPGCPDDSSGVTPSLSWQPCQEERLKGLECASLQVPLDHNKPEGEKILLALSRHVHSDSDYRGVILSHPGGPGGSGLPAPKAALGLPNDIGKKYDWVSLDPRGVGQSSPRLACTNIENSLEELPEVPQNDAQIIRWQQRAKDIAQNCAQGEGSKLLPFMHSSDLVKDLEAVRAALGVEKITYFGASYGSYVGQMYASMFPQRVEKMILDGVMSPIANNYDLNIDQQRAFQHSTNMFLEWLARHDERYGLGNTFELVHQKVYQALDKARSEAETPGKNIDQMVTQVLIYAGYGVRIWPAIAYGLSEWINRGEIEVVAEISSSDNPNLNSIYLAVMCSDTQWPNWEKTLSDARASHASYPLMSWHNTWFNSPCVEWSVPATPPQPIQSSQVSFPILLTSETFDAATPISGALDTRDLFPTAALVEGEGGSSHSTALSGSECTRQAIFDLLDRGALPARVPGRAADLKCPPRAPAQLKKKGYQALKPSLEEITAFKASLH